MFRSTILLLCLFLGMGLIIEGCRDQSKAETKGKDGAKKGKKGKKKKVKPFKVAPPPKDLKVPTDFKLFINSRPHRKLSKDDEQIFNLEADGKVNFKQGGLHDKKNIKKQLSAKEVATIYWAIKKNDFFSLEKLYKNHQVHGGDYVVLKVQGGGKTHRVKVSNLAIKAVNNVVRTVNAVTPKDISIKYNNLYRDVNKLSQEAGKKKKEK